MRSVYIHIPFCKSICSYCDFCKFIYNERWEKIYLEILEKEIKEYYENDKVKTLYIGGGTPSSLSLDGLNKLFNIINHFDLSECLELTFECNIDDINTEILSFLSKNGVNRLSVGVESFDKDNLSFLNRNHNKKDIIDKVNLAKKYFDNINVDLIYALPDEKMHTFKQDVKNVLSLDVSHISTYSLIIEQNTMLSLKKVKPIDEETDFKMYKYICKKLKKNGYNHYEVSNFAKKGMESKHNLTYWNNEEYYGFGLGAHGYINDMRYENTRNLNKYLNGEYRFNELLVSNIEQMENELILGLRKLGGINIKVFEEKYGVSIFEVFKLEDAIKKGLLILEYEYIKIPEDKIYIMNEIINMIM